MHHIRLLLPLLMFGPAAQSTVPDEPVPPAGYHQVRLNGHTFTLREGFTIEVAAGSPLVERPIVAAFDDQGNLYVCTSSGSNQKVAEQLQQKPHRVVRLTDADGDGRFDTATEFVSNVMLPEGAMWLDGSLYVSAPPRIMKFTDTDSDGKADKQQAWFDGKTLTGCANDLHGPYRGPDGYVYWCKGAFAKQDYTLENGRQLSTRASHIFRARPDGSNLEPVMTGGMDNPVDVVFTPSGERIFSTTFFQHPANGRRDGLVHAIYGGVYGKDHDPVYEHAWTSPELMPVMTHLGPAAPCGLHRYESNSLGDPYKDNLFCCQFNMRKVSRHVLVPSGSTFATRDTDFVISDNLDFHPTDVIEDADGSLLIIDTGGWYKLCCPTSQLVKPDVVGAIYRVRKKDAPKVSDPRGLKIAWAKTSSEELRKYLDDSRAAVRSRAIDTLAQRGEAAVATLAVMAGSNEFTERQKQGAIWALARIPGAMSRSAAREFLHCSDETTRNAATHVAAWWRDSEALAKLVKLLGDASLATRRVAAEALGRIGSPKCIPAILTALADEKNDRVLDHSLTYALMEIADPKETRKGLAHQSPSVRRAVLAALDGMPNGKLEAEVVLGQMNDKDPAVRATAWWIAGRHPQWGEHLAGYFREQFRSIETMTPPKQDELTSRFVPFVKTDSIRKEVGVALARILHVSANRSILRAMARSGLKTFPAEWKDGVQLALMSGNDDLIRDAIAVLRAVPPSGIDADDLISRVPAHRGRVMLPWKKEFDYALRATAPAGTKLSLGDAERVIADVHRDRDGPVRAAAMDLLARAALETQSLVAIAEALKTTNPAETSKLLSSFAKSREEKVGLALVRALSDPSLRETIRAEQIKPIVEKYPPPVRDEAEKLYALLAAARKGEWEKLARVFKELPPGDARRGQIVFNSSKAQCVSCHKIGYVGGVIGPDLTRVGGIRSEHDLLEAIVLPSASFVRSYEPVKVLTTDGRTLNGIVKKDAPDEVVLTLSADKEERLARADIEEMSPGSVSIMPAGFDQQLTLQEIADLIAFLKACR